MNAPNREVVVKGGKGEMCGEKNNQYEGRGKEVSALRKTVIAWIVKNDTRRGLFQ